MKIEDGGDINKNKTIVWSSMIRAFEKAVELQGETVLRPKALGEIRGVDYIYPMLYRFGVIEVPEERWRLRVSRLFYSTNKRT